MFFLYVSVCGKSRWCFAFELRSNVIYIVHSKCVESRHIFCSSDCKYVTLMHSDPDTYRYCNNFRFNMFINLQLYRVHGETDNKYILLLLLFITVWPSHAVHLIRPLQNAKWQKASENLVRLRWIGAAHSLYINLVNEPCCESHTNCKL